MTKREIRDEMVNVLLEAKLFPKFMQADMIKLGHTALVQPDSNIGYVIDAFAEAIYNRYEIYNQLNKSTIKNELTENQLENLKTHLDKKIHKPYRDMVDEFLSCYALTDEAAYALYEHVQQQTGLSKEEIVGED